MRISAYSFVAVACLWLLPACGGGGSAEPDVAAGAPTTPPTQPLGPERPSVALLVVSGHSPLATQSASYLHLDAGPEIKADLEAAGLTVATGYYVDDALPVGAHGGYYDLVSDMEFVRDTWAPQGTRVVLVAHSHGGVWAHAAVRAVAGLTVHCQVDLDCSSWGWEFAGHTGQNTALGGEPRSAYAIGSRIAYSAYPNVPSEGGPLYDLEDIVFPNVVANLDVRSGAVPVLFEWYDESWNIRSNGTGSGLYGYFSGTSHAEVHDAGGTTLAVVRSWLRMRLGV